METLLALNCDEIDDPTITEEEIEEYLSELHSWNLKEGAAITKTVSFDTFAEAIEYVNLVAGVAESEGHHPDIDIRYRTVVLSLSTHEASGLTLLDFIVAAKIDTLN